MRPLAGHVQALRGAYHKNLLHLCGQHVPGVQPQPGGELALQGCSCESRWEEATAGEGGFHVVRGRGAGGGRAGLCFLIVVRLRWRGLAGGLVWCGMVSYGHVR